jgi:hypothetical protein
MGNVNCSQICGPGERQGMDIDNQELDSTPMRPAKEEMIVEELPTKKENKKSGLPKPKVDMELFARKVISIDRRIISNRLRRWIRRWKANTPKQFIPSIPTSNSKSPENDFDERLKKVGAFVTEEDMKRQIKDIIPGIEKQLGPLNIDQRSNQGKTLFVRGPFRYHDRTIYKGSWSQDLRKSGYGILVKEDGSKYEGNWENDEQSGYGRYFDSKGNYFVGKLFIYNI